MSSKSRIARAGGPRVWTALLVVSWISEAEATFRYGPVQISGNLESQQLFRLDQNRDETFDAFNAIQQRNTFRFQYEHELVENGLLLGTLDVLPFTKKASFFAYYRFVYDSIYDIAPGPFLKGGDGSKGGGFERSFDGGERHALAFENVLREVFVDLELSKLPVSFRIGRQQMVWGNTVAIRAVDSINALDLTWHFSQEAGILGKVGFSELRIPAWAVKMLVKLPSMGPFSNNFIEAFDIPFEFKPTKVNFVPAPWGLPFRFPFRAGQLRVVQGQNLQLCFDPTGSRAVNDADGNPLTPDNIDFAQAPETGLCPTEGLLVTDRRRGVYDPHDPRDVNQFGVRYGGTFNPIGLGFTLSYKYQRHIFDTNGGTIAKSFQNLVASNALAYVRPSLLEFGTPTHQTTDPVTGETKTALGFVRVPIEFYYPYVSVFGLTADYFEEFTGSVLNLEVAAANGVPVANLNPDPKLPGLRRTWEMEIGLLVDRPTWIRFLNPRSTFTVLLQGNLSMVPDRKKVTMGVNPFAFPPSSTIAPISGDVGSPSSDNVPGLFRDELTLDQRAKYEYLTVLGLQTFYWGGSLAPVAVWVSNWNYAPTMEWQFFVQYLLTPNFIIEPGFRVFWTNGRTVDDRYSIGRMSGRSELQLKTTYQF